MWLLGFAKSLLPDFNNETKLVLFIVFTMAGSGYTFVDYVNAKHDDVKKEITNLREDVNQSAKANRKEIEEDVKNVMKQQHEMTYAILQEMRRNMKDIKRTMDKVEDRVWKIKTEHN